LTKNPGIFTDEGLASLKGNIAAICRHPYKGERSFVGFATHLGGGAFATISDGNLQLPFDKWDGLGRYSNLRIHLLDGSNRMFWIDWIHETPILPIAVLQVRGDGVDRWPTPELATMADMHGKNHVWRIGYAKGLFGDQNLDLRSLGTEPPHVVTDGWICYHPCMTYFRNGADEDFGNKHTIAGHVCFGYPNKSDLGGPVVDNEGRLAGVLVGADLGSQESHVGAYVPAELIIPFLASARKSKIYSEFRGQLHPVLHQIDESEVRASAA
jgi:hypothetical protein